LCEKEKKPMKKRNYGVLIIVLFAVAILFAPIVRAEAKETSTKIGLHGYITENEYKITWYSQGKDVTKYILYRQTYSGKKYGKAVKLAEISGGEKTYTDTTIKYNKKYKYTLKGYKISGKKKVLTIIGTAVVKTVVETPKYDYYDVHGEESVYNPMWLVKDGVVEGAFCTDCDNKVVPDGFDIYRATAGGSYKKILTVTDISLDAYDWTSRAQFEDSTIKVGKTYKYKAKAYVKINGKKKYTGFSKTYTVRARNTFCQLDVEKLTEDSAAAEEITFRVTSNKYNGTAELRRDCYRSIFEVGPSEEKEEYADATIDSDNKTIALNLKAYSYDGQNWIDYTAEKTIILEPGDTIYLNYVPADGLPFAINSKSSKALDFLCSVIYDAGTVLQVEETGEYDPVMWSWEISKS
jgi:hypothetical protein